MKYRQRIYGDLIERHLGEYRQMAFVAGARQVGKTTLCRRETCKRCLNVEIF